MTLTITQIGIIAGIIVFTASFLLIVGISIGYHLSRKTQGFRNILEDQDETE